MIFSKHNTPSDFYVYAYLRTDGTPYYIGKGQNARAWNKNHRVSVPSDVSRIIIIECNLTEIGSLAIERRLIRWYGRKDNDTGILRNLTDGGEGTSGKTISEETRTKMSAGIRGKTRSEEQRTNISNSKKGKTASEETRAKMSAAHKGKIRSEEHCFNLSAAKKGKPGKPHTEETRAKMSASQKGRPGKPHTEETRAKMSAAKKGKTSPNKEKTLTEEHRAKISAAKKR